MNQIYPTSWTCTNATASTTNCVVTATTTYQIVSTSTASSSPFIFYNDWLYVSLVLIFLTSFVPIGFLYNLFKPR